MNHKRLKIFESTYLNVALIVFANQKIDSQTKFAKFFIFSNFVLESEFLKSQFGLVKLKNIMVYFYTTNTIQCCTNRMVHCTSRFAPYFSLWLDSIIFNLFCSVLFLIFVRDAFVEENWELAHAVSGTIHMTWSMQQLCTGELVLEESKKQSIKLVQRMWTNYSISLSVSLSLLFKSVKGEEKRYARTNSRVLNPPPFSLPTPNQTKEGIWDTNAWPSLRNYEILLG